MKLDIFKSRLDIRKAGFCLLLSSFLLVTNLVGGNKLIYGAFDDAFMPFVITARNVGNSTALVLTEIFNKSNVLQENINLKRKILTYDQLIAENKSLQDQLNRMEEQTGIAKTEKRSLQLVQISGTQNLFSSEPELKLYLNSVTNLKKDSVVYYNDNTLFGFVKDIQGKTVTVVPFFAPKLGFNIPVRSLKNPNQSGFVNNIENNKIIVRNIAKDASLSVGDIWVTRNDVNQVPASLIVGKVKSVSRDENESVQQAELEVLFNLSDTTYVFIEKQ